MLALFILSTVFIHEKEELHYVHLTAVLCTAYRWTTCKIISCEKFQR